MPMTVADIYFALRTFLTPDDTVRWIRSPQPFLDNRTPLDLMETDEGCAKVYAAVLKLRNEGFV